MRIFVGVNSTDGLHRECIKDAVSFKLNDLDHLEVTAKIKSETKVVGLFKDWLFAVEEV